MATESRETLPILVPVEAHQANDGTANFQQIKEGDGLVSGPKVRLLRNRDITEQALRKTVSLPEYRLLTGVLDLKKARETGDSLLNDVANKKLEPFLDFPNAVQSFSYLGWANVHVPRLATQAMQGARLVLWYSRNSGRFIPAIYCTDLKTAIFVRAFLTAQTCPHCGVVFLPPKNNVIYCRPAHSHAHRMARLRANRGRKKGRRNLDEPV
jgi:hypothetical protein